ncbi:MAG: 3-phosphoshikimate 1-carboxyvinyltransferase [Clostridiales bacterium 38-18]|nr:MAG: 3-phosphoshikimate 1-carboxyvinyltransferase [Clostridiales bacterium 38-18]
MNEQMKITPRYLHGILSMPPSKSISHRAIICAALSQGTSRVENLVLSEDIKASIAAMIQFGAKIELDYNPISNRYTANIWGIKEAVDRPLTIDCRESGSTARFLIPFFQLTKSKVTFVGAEGLMKRPFGPYLRLFESQKLQYQSHSGALPITVSGSWQPGEYELVGNVSSQFITGLLFVLPLLEGDSQIRIKPPFESVDYVKLTISCLKKFGIDIIWKDDLTLWINGHQSYHASDYWVEGDYSQAAFWLVANSIGSHIVIEGLNTASEQGDKRIIEIIEQVTKQSESEGYLEIDVSQCPDLVPIIAVLCTVKPGLFKITGAERVRIKESNRLLAIASELNKLGALITETEDGLEIVGNRQLTGGMVEAWQDHRIAMALAIAATCANDVVTILGKDSVNKSYPEFWKDYHALGGVISGE